MKDKVDKTKHLHSNIKIKGLTPSNVVNAFLEAEDRSILIKDENLKYIYVNQVFTSTYKHTEAEVLGFNDFDLTDNETAQNRRQMDLDVLINKKTVTYEAVWVDRLSKITKFPIKMSNGHFGVGAYITDISEIRKHEKQQEKDLSRHKILTDVLTRSFQSKQEQLDFVLNEALNLTESKYGYIYLYDDKKCEFSLNSWTIGVMDSCEVVDKQTKYILEKTGLWGEVVRQEKPIIVNDFNRPNLLKKGYPNGHVQLKNFMSIPVIIDERILAVVGLGNKPGDYDDIDIYEITMLMNGAWNAVERREAQEKLSLERNKYLQTLISIGDGVMVVNQLGNIEMLNQVAEKLTGWSIDEALGKHYRDIFMIQNCPEIVDQIEGVLASDSIQKIENSAIVISRDGTEYYLEDSAAPIKDDTNTTIGVVLVLRDVTQKIQQREKIDYLSFHDYLTGLYNRLFLEEELRRLDTDRNLPISIIMGDVNGLKMTNDIFGHASGDLLIKSAAVVLKKVCREGDIVARVGGDEFVILLPNTTQIDAEKIICRINSELSNEYIIAIKCSMSLGCDTKELKSQDIERTMVNAESRMYKVKTLNRKSINTEMINTIIASLYSKSLREEQHSLNVSDICQNIGVAMKLPETEVKKLKNAGFLHDIGKIALDPRLLNKEPPLTIDEFNMIKDHPLLGYRILNSFDDTLDLADIVLAHHEHWDGSGYPKGLAGDEIPLIARIISVAEYYERILNSNSESINKDKAIKYIEDYAGRYFDPDITEVFIHIAEKED